MNNVFGYSRDYELSLEDKFTPRMKGACLSVLRYLAIFANHSPKTFYGSPVARGEIVVSVKGIKDHTGLSPKTIRTALDRLCEKNIVCQKGAHQGANRTILYAVVPYEDMDGLSEKGQTKGQLRGKQGATTKEEEGKEKEEKATTSPAAPPARKRDLFLDAVTAEWETSWPDLPMPKVALFARWRKEFKSRLTEDQIISIIKEIGLKGIDGEKSKNVTGYLFAVLKGKADEYATTPPPAPGHTIHKQANGAMVEKDEHGNTVTPRISAPTSPWVIFHPFTPDKPDKSPMSRRNACIRMGLDNDPDQGYDFTITDAYIISGDEKDLHPMPTLEEVSHG